MTNLHEYRKRRGARVAAAVAAVIVEPDEEEEIGGAAYDDEFWRWMRMRQKVRWRGDAKPYKFFSAVPLEALRLASFTSIQRAFAVQSSSVSERSSATLLSINLFDLCCSHRGATYTLW